MDPAGAARSLIAPDPIRCPAERRALEDTAIALREMATLVDPGLGQQIPDDRERGHGLR